MYLELRLPKMTQILASKTDVLLDKFKRTRKRTTDLVAPLHPEDFTPQSALFASPPKWHIAHTTWFFEEMILKQFIPDYNVFDENYGFLFNSYYNSIGQRVERDNRGLTTRPFIEDIMKYRAYVDNAIANLLSPSRHFKEEILPFLELGLNHEEQHQELLITDLKYTFSKNPIYPVYDEGASFCPGPNEENGWLAISEGIYVIGASNEAFSFDNEHGQHQVFLHNFQISKGLVTNREYIEFIEAGGYQKFEFWLDEGWSWVQESSAEAPLYWVKSDGKWLHYTLGGLKEINPDDILTHVNFYEASAFAMWKGLRLPTEFEWEAAAKQLNWGQAWEWTSSAYLPYPYFNIPEGAVGEYNGKFMVNQMVLRGASLATAHNHSRLTYRNFFHPHYQWQYTGIRLAKHI